MRSLRVFIILVIALVFAAACGQQDAGPAVVRIEPTALPTQTPLPPIPTRVPIGSPQNPITFVLVASDNASGSPDEYIEMLQAESGLSFAVTFVERTSDAYRALCLDGAHVALLDAFTYLAASQLGCGEVAYIVEVEGQQVVQGQLVAAAGRVFSVFNFAETTFCRPSADSVYGWILPGIAMMREGLDPNSSLNAVVDSGTDADTLSLITLGRCATGATLAGAEQTLANPALIDVIELLPAVPNDAIIVSYSLDIVTQEILANLLRQNDDELADLLGVEEITQADDTIYDPLRAFFMDAEIDIVALSN